MNEGTKKRLAGAIVLACLAIIFVPILLDGEGLRSPELEIDVPQAPELPSVADIEPQRPDFALEREREAEETGSDPGQAPEIEIDPLAITESDTTPAASEPEQPTLNEEGLPDVWSVRLASFGEQANAEALEQRLLEQDYKAYTRRYTNNNGTLTAVYVGPVITRERADALLAELESGFDLAGMVEKFSVE